MGNLFTAIIGLIIATLFILTGIVAASLPWMPDIQAAILKSLIEDTLYISLIGTTLCITGSAIITYIALNYSKKSFTIVRGNLSFAIDQKVLEKYIGDYFKRMHPKEELPHQVVVRKRRILLSTELPYAPKEQQEPIAEKVYDDIIRLLEEKFSCQKDLYLSITFPSAPKGEKVKC